MESAAGKKDSRDCVWWKELAGKDMGNMLSVVLEWHCGRLRNPAASASSAPFRQEAVQLGFKNGKAGDTEYQCPCLEGGWRIWATARAVPAGCLLWTQQRLRLGQTRISPMCSESETTSESRKSLLFLVHVLVSFLCLWM